MKKILVTAALLAVSATAAFAQTGTVNAYTSADEAKARAAVTAAGFTPVAVASSQGGALFIRSTKGTDTYFVTVLPSGQVIAGQPLGAPVGLAASNPNGPNRVGGAPAGRGPASGGD